MSEQRDYCFVEYSTREVRTCMNLCVFVQVYECTLVSIYMYNIMYMYVRMCTALSSVFQ